MLVSGTLGTSLQVLKQQSTTRRICTASQEDARMKSESGNSSRDAQRVLSIVFYVV